MAWVTPSTQVAGYLVTADDWNELVNNLKHLRGQDGTTVLEGDVDPNTDLSQSIGSTTKRWNEGHFNLLYAANGNYALHQAVRTLYLPWEDDTFSNYQISSNATGSGNVAMGGSGQIRLRAAKDGASIAYVAQQAELANALNNAWKTTRSPYMRVEFGIDDSVSSANSLELFIGLRQTIGDNVPVAAAENYAGLKFTGSEWQTVTADGTAETSDNTINAAITDGKRHVLEILITSEVDVQFFLDGTLQHTSITNLPTGDLEWSLGQESDGLSAVGWSYATFGLVILQEALGAA